MKMDFTADAQIRNEVKRATMALLIAFYQEV
jgi:hypothetical protein